MTPCECTQPGFCYRHQCHKTRHWLRLCQTRPECFLRWEETLGPGQDPSRPILMRPETPQLGLTVLMVTYNRLDYTRRSVAALLHSDYPSMNVVIWDNASTDGTRRWLASEFAEDSRVTLILSSSNCGTAHPMNVVWSGARTPLVAKVDNDTLIPADLFSRLAGLHASFEVDPNIWTTS